MFSKLTPSSAEFESALPLMGLDYIEGQGQVLGYYTNELRQRGYQKAICYLPHDGVNANSITGLRCADI